MSDFRPPNYEDLHKLYWRAGQRWSERKYAADLLEDGKKTLVAQLMCSYDGSIAARKMQAEASAEYKEHEEAYHLARKRANKARVSYDSIASYIDSMKEQARRHREEMRLQ